MTEQEALKIMSIEKAIELNNRRFFCNTDEIINVIAEWAMRKQIPQKPMRCKEQPIYYTTEYECPSCGGKFTGMNILKYCYHCGQRLSWN